MVEIILHAAFYNYMASLQRKLRVGATAVVILYLFYTFGIRTREPKLVAQPEVQTNGARLRAALESNAEWKQTGLNFHLEHTLREQLEANFPYEPKEPFQRNVWQTWKVAVEDALFPENYKKHQRTWEEKNPDYKHYVITDAQCDVLVNQLFADVPQVAEAWNLMPKSILKADFFRYLILFARGGVYSDIDTRVLKPIDTWVSAQETVHDGPNRAGLVVGIEADPDRPDWNEWYARRIQFCQWTIQAKKGHPMLRELVARITELTLERKRNNQLRTVLGKDEGGDIMDWTGPGIFTDMVFAYMNAVMGDEESVTWRLFTGLRVPLVLEDVMVLPITSFSPNVGQMGAGPITDKIAYVQHMFLGSWKHDEKGKGKQ